jgi:hypothetical protein
LRRRRVSGTVEVRRMKVEPKLTRQGVRALGLARPIVPAEPELEALTCEHRPIRYCCPTACGHLVCSCGLSWDEGAER